VGVSCISVPSVVPDCPCVLSRKLLVTVGAAAPVIALAAVVSLTDILGSRRFYVIASLPDLLPSGKDDRALYTRAVIARGVRRSRLAYPAVLANMALQAAMLAAALYSLAQRDDSIPPLLAVIAEPLGVLLLSGIGALAIRLQSARRAVEEYRQESSDH
jgi:hypothetical protein